MLHLATPFEKSAFRLPSLLLASALLCGVSSTAEARRTVIDGNAFGNTYEISTDVENGFGATLPFSVNYGSGLQSALTVNLGTCCIPAGPSTPPQIAVGLTFTNSPTDFLFASVLESTLVDAAVRTSHGGQASTPLSPVQQADLFNFGMAFLITGGPPQVPTAQTGDLGFYSPFFGNASFQFIDLSSSGVAGDFGLNLLCNSLCANIGFNLAGLNFSSTTFDPNAAPSQLVSFNLGTGTSSFNFVFRNVAGVPEPGTWMTLLVGFGLAGFALRRTRRPRAVSAQSLQADIASS